MNSSVFSFLSDFVFLLLLFIQIPSSLSNEDLFTACKKEFVCGNISAGFPFLGAGRPPACGIHELELRCNEHNITTMNINQVAYRVLKINREDEILRIAREDYLAGLCPPQFANSTFNPKVFEPVEGYEIFTFIYGCKDGPRTFTCEINDVNGQSVYNKEGENGPEECNGSVIVPVSISESPPGWNIASLEEKLKKGFEVRWNFNRECQECSNSRGVCGFDNDASQTTCYYPGNEDLFTACSKKSVCGGISAGFPFWGAGRPSACGIPELELKCRSDDVAKMNIDQVAYSVLEIKPDIEILRIEREDYLVGLCPPQFMNSTFNPKIFEPVEGFKFIYGCKDASTTFTCKINYVNGQSVYIKGENGPGECNGSVFVPVSITESPPVWNTVALEERLKEGFEVRWKFDRECQECSNSSGVCGFDNVANKTTCYYRESASRKRPLETGSTNGTRQLWIAMGSSIAAATIVTSSIITICLTRKKGSFRAVIAMAFRQKNSQHVDTVETFMMDHHSLTPKRFSYLDIKKMTNSFVYTLGHGGFGNVYRGKLPDGRLVAVKVLKESKGDGEEFMNEVASISRTSHVNVVTLLGFCYERNKRALIYEFMPNGSLDSFISDKDINCRLEWKKLYEIAVGIARGLEYLHRGCNTSIVHFDIKPHNILLDEDFHPKISDFGLAKLCKSKVSKISLIGARGTIGYIAPEVFCRNFGGVTYKSDVYSYGMMVLEMVGQRKDFDMGSMETNEMYFPDWFYMYLEPGEISTLHRGVTEEEEEIVKKMIVVGLWCIQTIPSHRPSMTKVVEMFEGSLQSLQIPPRPSLNSPRKVAQELYSSTASSLPC